MTASPIHSRRPALGVLTVVLTNALPPLPYRRTGRAGIDNPSQGHIPLGTYGSVLPRPPLLHPERAHAVRERGTCFPSHIPDARHPFLSDEATRACHPERAHTVRERGTCFASRIPDARHPFLSDEAT